jgi:hypothetical protein
MKESFLRQFPGGFEDAKYVKFERAYKVAASDLLKKTLSAEELNRLLKAGDHSEVCRRALAVVSRTNLVSPSEKMDLQNGLTGEGLVQFSRALADLLYGSSSSQDRFERFAKMLEGIGAAKWTIATYFRFLAEPETEMFLKAEATKAAAEACGIELNYRPDLNWQTYQSLLAVAASLREAIGDLRPRDMIDVQGFIWKARTRE